MSRDHLPLHGIRVLDMTGGLGTYCGRLLADFGADVVKIEPPEGVRSRGIPPFIDDEPGIDRSLRFLYFEANKRGIVLDVSSPDAESELRQLAAEVDVILVTPSAQHPVSGFDPVSESISWAPKTAIVICITPFGLTGPYREWRGTHLTSYAMSGLLVSQGTPEGPPVVIPGDQMHTHISTNAAIAVMTALRARDQVGGQFADLSAHEILFAGHFPFNRYSTSNFIPEREAIEPNQSGGIWECSDGLVEFFVSTDKHWQGLMTLLGDPESLSDPTLANPNTRYDRREEVIAALGPLVKAIDREDFVARGQRLGVPCALLNTIGEFVNDPQPRSRDFLTITLLPDGREVEMPGAPYRSTEPLLDLYRR
ncbi:MAG: hypothetical protein JWO10_290, partial [Microbacteriaceae bacterium]|nr:hypothetical protein [Microbacteriaceae bacterium]